MNDPQQIRRALTEIRRALDTHSRESLAEILAIVFKEYVVEGGAPIASGGNVLDARSDIEGMSFPELVVWLQTHHDAPELALFEVAGSEVSVRAGTGRVPIRANAPAPVAAPTPAPPPIVAVPTVVRAQPMPVAQQPRPTAQPQAPTPASAPAQAQPAAAAKDDATTSETGTRFSLLEVD